MSLTENSFRPEKIVFGCVADNNEKYLSQALRLLRSIRWFGGALAGADVLVCLIEEAEPRYLKAFESLDATVRIVERFDLDNPFFNKVQLFEQPDLIDYDMGLLIDCDTVIVDDPSPFLQGFDLRAKVADGPTVPSDVLARLCRHFGLEVPEARYRTTFGSFPTIWYCNAGVVAFRPSAISRLVEDWRKYELKLTASPDLLGPYQLHRSQAALALAFISRPVSFGELPVSMNFPLHLTHLDPPDEMLRSDPVILHYHDRVDTAGYLLPSPYVMADRRICLFNDRLREFEAQGRSARTELSPAPFIIGSDRSGTTLLRMMLDTHPQMAIPPETHFIPQAARACRSAEKPADRFVETLIAHPGWPDFHLDEKLLRKRIKSIEPFDLSAALRAFYQLNSDRFGKSRWGDQTPAYARDVSLIEELIPEAHFIHIIRDGRDVALSCKGLWFAPDSMEELARHWASRVQAARRHAGDLRRYLEIRYEDLLLNTETTLRRVCDFLDLPFDPAMLDYHLRADERINELRRPVKSADGRIIATEKERISVYSNLRKPMDVSRLGRWRTEMSDEDLACFETTAGEALKELGYALGRNSSRYVSQEPWLPLRDCRSWPVSIAGMHRSGTSMVARMLYACGLYLGPPRELGAPANDNPEGFWENIGFRRLNDELLGRFGGSWDAPPLMPQGWETGEEIAALRDAAEEIAAQIRSHRHWGWKDPRNSLTFSLWKRIIPNLKAVICVRNPIEVSRSLVVRNRMSEAAAIQLWLIYNRHLLAVVPPEDRVVTHYDSYFHDPRAEIRRVLERTGLRASDEAVIRACDTISTGLRHHHIDTETLIASGVEDEVIEVYLKLCAEAGPVYQQVLQGEPAAETQYDSKHRNHHILRMFRLEARLAQQEQLLRERDAEVSSLKALLAERDADIASLKEAHSARKTIKAVLRKMKDTARRIQERA